MLTTTQCGGALIVCSILLMAQVNRLVPEPYMDEIFHIRQTQAYCAGRWFEWDPKITTFPGLYIMTAVCGRLVYTVMTSMGLSTPLCDVTLIRWINFALGMACLPVMMSIARRQGSTLSDMTAFLAWLLPTHFFFNFLFYTDVASVLFVLSMYDLSRRDQPILSAVLALVSVAIRQTNAVWVAFSLGIGIVEDLGIPPSGGVCDLAKALLTRPGKFINLLVTRWKGQVSILAGFTIFLAVNDGVTIGDKSNHAPTLHIAQLCYAAVFICLASLPVTRMDSAKIPRLFRLAAAAIGCAAAIKFTARAHPFLLADNRHYMFYVWRRMLQPRPMVWVPLYAWSLTCMWDTLGRSCGLLWRLGYFMALALTIVPSPLIEPRYYTIPALLAILHMPRPARLSWPLWLGLLASAAANAVTLWIFLYRPFVWVDGSVARFMW